MRRLTTALLISFALIIVSCGGGGGDGDSGGSACSSFKVLNGVECTSDSLPVVLLEIDGQGSCTGTIISNDEVLTAAHCVGSHSVIAVHDKGTQSAVAGYANALSSQSLAFDTGIIKFPNIATNFGLTPARFGSSRHVVAGDTIKLVGYGLDGTPALANGNPRGTELLVAHVEDGFIFAEFDKNNTGGCEGDSGAAITLNGLIVGTVQGGLSQTGCADGTINIFTDMQVNGNVDFVKQYAPGAVFE